MSRSKLRNRDSRFQQKQSELAQAAKDFYRKLSEQYQRLGSEQFRRLHGVCGSSRRASSHVNKAYQRYMRELKGNPQKRLNQLDRLNERIQSSLTLHFESNDHDDASVEAHTQQSCDSNHQTLTSLPQRIFERELNSTLSPYEFRIINDSSNQQPNQATNGTFLSREVNYAEVCQQFMGVFLILNNLPEALQTNITEAMNATLDDIAAQVEQIGQPNNEKDSDEEPTWLLVLIGAGLGVIGTSLLIVLAMFCAQLYMFIEDKCREYRRLRDNEQHLLPEQEGYDRNEAHPANLEMTSVSCFSTRIQQIKEVVTNADIQWHLDIMKKSSTKKLQTFLDELTHDQLLAVAQLPPRYFRLNVLQAIKQYADTQSVDLSVITQKLNLYEQLNGKLENIVLPERQIEAQTEQVKLHKLSKLVDDYLQNDVADKRFKVLLHDNYEVITTAEIISFKSDSDPFITLDLYNLDKLTCQCLDQTLVAMKSGDDCIAITTWSNSYVMEGMPHPYNNQDYQWRILRFKDDNFDIELLNLLIALQAEAYKNPDIHLTRDAFEYIVNLRQWPQSDLQTIGHKLDSPFHDCEELSQYISHMPVAEISGQQYQQIYRQLTYHSELPDNSFAVWLKAQQEERNESTAKGICSCIFSLFVKPSASWCDLKGGLEALFEQRLSRFICQSYTQLQHNNQCEEQNTADSHVGYSVDSAAAAQNLSC